MTTVRQRCLPPRIELPLVTNRNIRPRRSARTVPDLGRLAAAGAAVVHGARVRSVGADVLERAGVAVVGVDAADLASVVGRGALDVDVALALAGALFRRTSSVETLYFYFLKKEGGGGGLS